jgi:Holliday junction resolvase
MRLRAKTDDNHAEIVKYLRAVGCSVLSLASMGKGCPDLLVGKYGHNFLMEIKGGNGKLTADEKKFHDNWRGRIAVVHTMEEAISIVA